MEQNFIILLILCKVPAIQSEHMVKQLARIDQNNQNTYLIDRITTLLQILLQQKLKSNTQAGLEPTIS